ncbi:hypothetical protein AKL17_3p0031 (plasmid) [Frigidibacter mobilis]|uniref:Uncharacterized protein n=1 Tax=Frigidibacter mobilis TaxID=1335048 RepID=A0A159Z9D5_9RHOB|nr:hypothetical protein AKL17_3p0031 [Frigidibacter mobilis]
MKDYRTQRCLAWRGGYCGIRWRKPPPENMLAHDEIARSRTC